MIQLVMRSSLASIILMILVRLNKLLITAARIRRFLWFGVLGLFLICPLFSNPLKIAYSDWPGWVAWEVGLEKGMFEDAGVEVDAKNRVGETALMLAAKKGDIETMRVLLQSRADINTKNKSRLTALMYAAKNGITDATKFLIDAGANINGRDREGKTALMYVCEMGETEIEFWSVMGTHFATRIVPPKP